MQRHRANCLPSRWAAVLVIGHSCWLHMTMKFNAITRCSSLLDGAARDCCSCVCIALLLPAAHTHRLTSQGCSSLLVVALTCRLTAGLTSRVISATAQPLRYTRSASVLQLRPVAHGDVSLTAGLLHSFASVRNNCRLHSQSTQLQSLQSMKLFVTAVFVCFCRGGLCGDQQGWQGV